MTVSGTPQSGQTPSKDAAVLFRSPKTSDAAVIAGMVRESKVLDPNSDYSYLLLCSHFSDTCLIAEGAEGPAGFVTGYTVPKHNDTLFIWQIYVEPVYRRTGLGISMIEALLEKQIPQGICYIEATINPSNKSSQKMFQFLAAKHNTRCEETVFFNKDLFQSDRHEEEVLYRIGPIKSPGGK
ncbi:MAG: diaminobutyrate acetyltransferase [Candidatus Omnitrophica bacterium]|nr:diaminobutyrate acetyltransferase [Candidatus Omnitrophota bacterium]